MQKQVALITGGTTGIGLRTAELFVKAGASVVITGRREDVGRAQQARLGSSVRFTAMDITVESSIRDAVATTVSQFGRLDCLVNNAGGPAAIDGIEGLTVEDIDSAIALLFRGPALCMKHAVPVMKEQRVGCIVNNASIAGSRAGYSVSMLYSAAKAAVIHLTRSVALELADFGIRVNSVSPGVIATGFFGKVVGLTGRAAEDSGETLKELLQSAQPIQRAGVADDVAKAVLWLASHDASFITGHDLVVDGGMTAGRPWTPQQEGMRQMKHELLLRHGGRSSKT